MLKKIFLSCFFLTSVLASSHLEIMKLIPYIANDEAFQKITRYVKENAGSSEVVHIKLAMRERRQYLESWRNSYYKNYTLPWFAFHLTGDVMLAATLGLAGGGISKLCRPGGTFLEGFAVGSALGIFLALKNITYYSAGCLSSIHYRLRSVDLQIARLKNLLAETKS